MKAIVLFSGGLDSCLVTKIISLQGIKPIALYFKTPFTGKLYRNVKTGILQSREINVLKRRASQVGAELKVFTTGNEYIEIIRSPRYGYGTNMNPCIDCKIYFYRKAYEIMIEEDAQFLVTGEVLGQRPMTQSRPTLIMMERRAGVEGLVLRPLSAKLLPRTIPQEKGWVREDMLYDIQGRSRYRQMELAKALNVTDYPSPAGGCLLTDPGFSRRLKDLFEHNITEMNDILLLKIGRHFRLSDNAKLIVGRNQSENRIISELVEPGDILLEVEGYGSPLCLLRGMDAGEYIKISAQICKRYSDARNLPEARVRYWRVDELATRYLTVTKNISEQELKEKMIV